MVIHPQKKQLYHAVRLLLYFMLREVNSEL